MGSTQADRALGGPNMAVRLGHRRADLFNALQMVSSGKVARAAAGRNALTRQILHTAMI